MASSPTSSLAFNASAWQSALGIGGVASPTFVNQQFYDVLTTDKRIITNESNAGSNINLNFPAANLTSGNSIGIIKVSENFQTNITGADFLIGSQITNSVALTRRGEAPDFYSDGSLYYLI